LGEGGSLWTGIKSDYKKSSSKCGGICISICCGGKYEGKGFKGKTRGRKEGCPFGSGNMWGKLTLGKIGRGVMWKKRKVSVHAGSGSLINGRNEVKKKKKIQERRRDGSSIIKKEVGRMKFRCTKTLSFRSTVGKNARERHMVLREKARGLRGGTGGDTLGRRRTRDSVSDEKLN